MLSFVPDASVAWLCAEESLCSVKPIPSSTHSMTEPASSCRVEYLRATRCLLTMWSMRGLSYCLRLWTAAKDYQQILSDEQSCASSLCLLEGCSVWEGWSEKILARIAILVPNRDLSVGSVLTFLLKCIRSLQMHLTQSLSPLWALIIKHIVVCLWCIWVTASAGHLKEWDKIIPPI